jgi:thiamine transporter
MHCELKSKKSLIIAEMSVSIALAFVLHSLIVILRLPNGGSVTLGNLPLLIFALRRKLKLGIISGLIYGTIKVFVGFHMPPISEFKFLLTSILFDYLLSYSCFGIVTIFFYQNLFHKKTAKVLFGIIFVYFLRFIFGVISGIIVWSALLPQEVSAVMFSSAYNAAYIFPEMIIILIIFLIITNYDHKFNFIFR